MAVQAVVDEQLGAVLQRRDVARAVRCPIERIAAIGSQRQCRQQGQRRNQFFQQFHDSLIPSRLSAAGYVTRSGTGLNVPIGLHHGINRKKPKYTKVQICDTSVRPAVGGKVPR